MPAELPDLAGGYGLQPRRRGLAGLVDGLRGSAPRQIANTGDLSIYLDGLALEAAYRDAHLRAQLRSSGWGINGSMPLGPGTLQLNGMGNYDGQDTNWGLRYSAPF